MKVKVLQEHPGEGQFPTFPKGTKVTFTGEECTDFLHWYPCEIDGRQTYVPDTFVSDGALSRNYNPTELVQNAGDILNVEEIVNAWLLATNKNGQTGWIPAGIVVSDPLA